MEFRNLGATGLKVSVLSFATISFGGSARQSAVGSTGVEEARRLLDRCLEAGVNLFDTADVHSSGESEEVLGEALRGRRDRVLLATKVNGRMGEGPNDAGQSRSHVIRACEDSLCRLGTDWIDLYQVHSWDGHTPLDETLFALDHLVQSGKVRYIGCSNYSGWHLMKALAVSDRFRLQRYGTQQINYSLLIRDAEYELVPIAILKASVSSSGVPSPAASCRGSSGEANRPRRGRASRRRGIRVGSIWSVPTMLWTWCVRLPKPIALRRRRWR